MSKTDLSQPTRQSVKGLVIIFIQAIRSFVKMFWALIAVLAIQRNIQYNKELVLAGIGILLVLLIVHSVLYYLNFFFFVKNGEFILKTGYLRKNVLAIPLERIQSINTKQNILQQALDVVALEIDTAGTAGNELKIHALEKEFATELSLLLGSKKETVTDHTTGQSTATESGKTEQLILRLLPQDLLKIGISQNHFRTALIILAFGYQIFTQVQEVFKEKADEYSGEFVRYLSGSSVALLLFLLVFFLLVSVLFSLFRTLFKYYDFSLFKNEKAYRVEAGLLNKRNILLPHNKIQQLNWETGPLKRALGIYNLVFKQAVSQQNPTNKLVDAPGCLNQHLELLKKDLFGEDHLSGTPKFFSDFHLFKLLWFFSGWLPVLATAPFLYQQWIFWLCSIIWLALTGGYNYLFIRKKYFQISNTQIRVSSGAIAHTRKQMELYKIQSVQFKQSIFHKRKSLATLQLMNASGTLTIPYINEELARQLYNYLLYHSEISTKKWM